MDLSFLANKVYAAPTITDLCDGNYKSGLLKGLPCDRPIADMEDILKITKNIVTDLVLPVVGVIFTIMIIFGGLQYISSAGNKDRIAGAKKTLTFAIIGLLLVILSEVIIGIVANFLGGGIV